MDARLLQRLRNQLIAGRVLLFVGAGFSRSATSTSGEPLPGVDELRKALWDIAFPGNEFDGSDLDDVYESAAMQAGRATIDLMRSRLSVDPAKIPDEYKFWLSFPWYRAYSLNIDDLEQAGQRGFDLPRAIRSVSALRDPFPASSSDLLWVHLNGDLQDLPDVTFSQRQYGERQATWDVWYSNLVREMQHHPVLFVGTSLDEPPLWQYVEARGRKAGRRELRPGSYLVTKELRLARRTSLSHYNVDFVPGTADEFARTVLTSLTEASEIGQRALRQGPGQALGTESAVGDLAELMSDSADDEREFLLGREPRWSDFTSGYAVEREFDGVLANEAVGPGVRLVLITGTAGSGKSSAGMRLVLSLQAEGRRVAVVDILTEARIPQIRARVQVAAPDVIFIDDVARFGSAAWGLLEDLVAGAENLLVVACLRSAAYQRLELPDRVAADQRVLQRTVPPLEDNDIDALIGALDQANRLGTLRGKSMDERRQAFSKSAGRQLLVAMIEATSGLRFDEKVESECRQLEAGAGLIYAVLSISGANNAGLRLQELLTACGSDGGEIVRALDELERQHLVVRRRGFLYLRHVVVADRAFRFYRETRQLADPLRGLVFAMATASSANLRQTRQGRLLIRLLNHDRLLQWLANSDAPVDLASVRGIYEEVETLLSNDHHYWLQRGSLETEEGSLELAKNFLDQARSLAPDDPYVQSEWAYMSLKRAYLNAADPDSVDQANTALDELRDVVVARGRQDSYPYHIFGSQGLAWAKRSPLAHDEKVRLMLELRDVVAEGVAVHPSNRELHRLRQDLDREYLMLAVPEADAT